MKIILLISCELVDYMVKRVDGVYNSRLFMKG